MFIHMPIKSIIYNILVVLPWLQLILIFYVIETDPRPSTYFFDLVSKDYGVVNSTNQLAMRQIALLGSSIERANHFITILNILLFTTWPVNAYVCYYCRKVFKRSDAKESKQATKSLGNAA
jgi:hypothetical protein